MIDLNLIQAFLVVARLGGINQAARKLALTPSAVSQKVKAIEAMAGKSLFLRKQSGMELNADGKKLYEMCKQIEKHGARIEEWFGEAKNEVSGEIRISSIPLVSGYIFESSLKNFLEKYPKIQVSIDAAPSDVIEDIVLKGAADIGIIAGECKKPSLKSMCLLSNNNVLAVYSPAKGKKITLQDIKRSTLILHGSTQSRTTKEIYKKIGLHKIKNAKYLLVPDMDTAKRLATSGTGIAFVAKMYVMDELKKGILAAADGFVLRRSIYMISRNDKYQSKAVSALKGEVISHCRRLDEEFR